MMQVRQESLTMLAALPRYITYITLITSITSITSYILSHGAAGANAAARKSTKALTFGVRLRRSG